MEVDTLEDNIYQFDEEFRDTIATVDERGKRIWVYPKKPSGSYHRKRIIVTASLLLLLFITPFITYQGHPLFLFNFLERKFILFGQIFWPQDFFLLAMTLISFFVFIILFTVLFGRIWCGWMCPQTLFMEMVFRKIEYWVEGNANEQRKLDQSPWSMLKIVKKGGKHLIFFQISLLIAHLVMAYIIGVEGVVEVISRSPLNNLGGFIALMAFTFVFYGVFAYFREQVCVSVCPYGRLQGVLLVKDSISIMYDWLRGEPRGKRRKRSATNVSKQGDCVDCKLCIHVCPTGIDIRNGTQLECVNCTACMDACDRVMKKMDKPVGLIRYSSYNAVTEGKQQIFTPRTVGYSTVLVGLIGVLTYFISTRSDVEATVLKMPGALYSKSKEGMISNVYRIEFVNKTFEDMPITIRVDQPKYAKLATVGDTLFVVPKEGILDKLVIVKIPEQAIENSTMTVVMGMYHHQEKVAIMKGRFIGPINMSKK